jgi:hypothetical protein
VKRADSGCDSAGATTPATIAAARIAAGNPRVLLKPGTRIDRAM